MSIFVRLVACAAVLESACSYSELPSNNRQRLLKQFQDFRNVYGKVYSDDVTLSERLEVFARNVDFIDSFNRNSTAGGLRLGVNQFADLTAAEFKKQYLSSLQLSPPPGAKNVNIAFEAPPDVFLPDSIDWRKKGAVTPVKDQKNCGACWAFSTTGAIEGAWKLAGNPLVSLSEQELVDCSAGWKGGCAGGEPSSAFEWVQKNGICSNQSYPWTSFQDECHNQFSPCQSILTIQGYTRLPESNENALKAAVAQRPVSVEIEADTDLFRFYKSGVLKGQCGTSLDHAVLAVGYGTDAGQDYWLVKNSWNDSWGEQGYVRLARTSSAASPGECGIAMHAMFPVIGPQSVLV
eukprot:TRINITY_DN42810_c0_g1_i1.p1 TRINITY_DN42810_c0_g1~~TRINITY_DN42810_c0_g1_i1.p1  ORF type:complete len:349 (+),score=48.60 TRINITY_DN42810_c0_g1_i1:57-1103(+)